MRILDRREIEFDSGMVLSAIASSPKAVQSFGLPAMAPTGIRFNPKAGCAEVFYGNAHSTRAIAINAVALGAILVSYCIRARIPMPRKSDKGIRLEEQSVILAFRTRVDGPHIATLPESTSRAAESVTAWTWLSPDRVPLVATPAPE